MSAVVQQTHSLIFLSLSLHIKQLKFLLRESLNETWIFLYSGVTNYLRIYIACTLSEEPIELI